MSKESEDLKKAIYLFNQGKYYDLYQTFGSQKVIRMGMEGFRFTVWAPHAKEIHMVSDFTDWETGASLEMVGESGVWTGFFPQAKEGMAYKYRIIHQDGSEEVKIDPFAFEFEVRPHDASIVKELPKKRWSDNIWMTKRKRLDKYKQPLNIYEVHLSSWKHHEDGSWYTLKELEKELIPYVKEMGYTHIQFMPLMEHPLDASWGYQVTGFFALSSKYGSVEDLQDFVEACHNENLGVLLDWVPSHFNRNAYGMAYYDGTPTFEYQDELRANNNRWGTLNFDLAKNQVKSFLISNAIFWVNLFHFDGLRIDAVSSMLYLDYDDGPWVPNEDGTNHHWSGIGFLQDLNQVMKERYSDVLMIAEESTSYNGVTRPVRYGGLGFHYKWNMGWMNDTLTFFEMDPIYRSYHFRLITFSFMYTFNENFILPFSHDEVVHGKKSLMHKMPGDRYNQFAGLRTIEAYRMFHPGKKLHFMGTEFGQFIEWRFYEGLDWLNLQDQANRDHQHFVKSLNHFYQRQRSLWEIDHHAQGLKIIDATDEANTILTFIRQSSTPNDFLIIACNFRPVEHHPYRLGVPFAGQYEEVFNTEYEKYGGTWTKSQGTFCSSPTPQGNLKHSIDITLPALGVCVFRPKGIMIQ